MGKRQLLPLVGQQMIVAHLADKLGRIHLVMHLLTALADNLPGLLARKANAATLSRLVADFAEQIELDVARRLRPLAFLASEQVFNEPAQELAAIFRQATFRLQPDLGEHPQLQRIAPPIPQPRISSQCAGKRLRLSLVRKMPLQEVHNLVVGQRIQPEHR
jgi:hypothetical protein